MYTYIKQYLFHNILSMSVEISWWVESKKKQTYFSSFPLFENLNVPEHTFHWELNFDWLNYDEKMEITNKWFNDFFDSIPNKQLPENWYKSDNGNFLNSIYEIMKNTANHSWTNAEIDLQWIEDISQHKIHIHFLIKDYWPGLDYEESNLKNFFSGRPIPNWEKKGQYNGWHGLVRIWKQFNFLDLRLHNNKRGIFVINDLGLQGHLKPGNYFWYEGYCILDAKQPHEEH